MMFPTNKYEIIFIVEFNYMCIGRGMKKFVNVGLCHIVRRVGKICEMSMQPNAQYAVKDRSPLYYYYCYCDDNTIETYFVSYLGVPLQIFRENLNVEKITFN